MTCRFAIRCSLLLTFLAIAVGWSSPAATQEARSNEQPTFNDAALEFFEKEVRPLLARRCYECHSGKSEEVKGGLRLDSRIAAIQGGDTGPALEPGKPKASLLVDAINYGDVYQMPPKSKMPADEIAVLTKWVAMGAAWPDEDAADVASTDEFDLAARKASHWCWQPVKEPLLPVVRQKDWPQQELDFFILRKLEEHGLQPAVRADRRTLIRRAYFDLIGLPPTAEEVAAFVKDDSPRAFEKVIDRLLKSPHFGERWARHWMDLVRYAETYGHEFDYPIPHAFKYRDYLIRAFNADVPYDQFVVEHIAGDLLTSPRTHPVEGYNESQIATGFWWLGEATHAPVDVRGDEADRIDNQLDVMGKTFLGLTIGCARCHDHKFDAISTKDYYSLSGFLQSSRRHEAFLDPGGHVAKAAGELKVLKREANAALQDGLAKSRSRGSVSQYLLAAREMMYGGASNTNREERPVAEVAAEFDINSEALNAWISALASEDIKQPAHPLFAWHSLSQSPSPKAFDRFRDRIANDANRRQEFQQQYPLLSDFSNFEDWFTAGEAFGDGPTAGGEWNAVESGGTWAGPGVASSGQLSNRLHGVLRSPTFTLNHRNLYYRIKGRGVKVRLILDGYFMDVYNGLLFRGFNFDVKSADEFTWHRQAQDIGRYLGHRAYIEVIDHGDGFAEIDEIRFSNQGPPPKFLSPLAAKLVATDVQSLEDLARAYEGVIQRIRSTGAKALYDPVHTELANWLTDNGLLPLDGAATKQLASAKEKIKQVRVPAPERVLGLTDGTGENEHVFIRGNHRTLGREAPRRFLTALTSNPSAIESGSGRLLLARQIASPDNPLTSRVMVNRLWHHLFGRGIVASTNNFGVLGQEPTHPELLDYLANQFVRDGWSIKRMLRTIMRSSTYQVASTPNAAAEQVDPQNELLHRARIRRLEGEAIRDAILAISGRLDRTVMGKSVPVHITPFMQGRGRPGKSGPLDGNGRRSLYIEVRRNFLSPMMLAFDTPIPFNSIGRRNVSNVPAQALILMNDPFVLQQAKQWASRIVAETSSTDERIRQMYREAFARPPTSEEIKQARAFLQQQGAELGLSADQVESDERVWADLCHVLMNVKEFVFLN